RRQGNAAHHLEVDADLVAAGDTDQGAIFGMGEAEANLGRLPHEVGLASGWPRQILAAGAVAGDAFDQHAKGHAGAEPALPLPGMCLTQDGAPLPRPPTPAPPPP